MNHDDITYEFACRDDCLDQMVPSDLRQLIAERDWLRDILNIQGKSEKVTVEGTISGDMVCWCLDVDEGTYRKVKGDTDYILRKRLHEDDVRKWREMCSAQNNKDTFGNDIIPKPEPRWSLYPDDLIKAKGRVRLMIMVEKLGD